VALADTATVDRAVAAAVEAARTWNASSLTARTNVLFAFRERLLAARDDVARTITSEHGKTFDDARGEVTRGLQVVEFAAGLAHLLKGEHSESVGTGVDSHSLRQPLGVVAGITPFNFPAMVPLWMAPVALACGNAFVLKPSERDPSTSLLLAELLADAGLPAGAFSVVQGDREAVDRLLVHPDVAAVSFVGSTPGRQARAPHRLGGGQARPGARRREEPRRRPARRGPRRRRRRHRVGRLRVGGAALHGDLGGGRRWATEQGNGSPPPSPSAPRGCASAPAPIPRATWAR
jgi:malonate-semialdehyde dehydrogenase (acetylating)/methylmalonate-semialdehyde dehydrogenase